MKHLILALFVGYLGLYNGQLALFNGSNPAPDTVLPYRVELYPEADRESLRNGIPYNSENELNRLLEDFLS